MEVKVVLDISSIVWDDIDFVQNKSLYYSLKNDFFLFIQAFESCKNLKFVARKELLGKIQSSFPYKITNEHNMFDFQRLVLCFLSTKRNVSYADINDTNISSLPNICFNYFSPELQTEIGYLITEMHTTDENYIFCTFSCRWNTTDNLKTKNSTTKEHQTVIHGNGNLTIQDYYNTNIRNIFEPNPKHDRVKVANQKRNEVSKLSCFDGVDTSVPQSLLDNATECNADYYAWDSHNQTFVCFTQHLNNKYHGYDEKISNVPSQIRNIFHK